MLKKILLIPDTHAPYHDKRALSLVIKVAKRIGITTLVIGGDFADFYAVSAHSKCPSRAKLLKDELEIVNEELDRLDDIGAKEKIFVEGNHEDRLRRYIQDKAPELYPLVNAKALFRLEERGYRYVPYKEDIRIGKLYITHDCGNSGKNAVRQALDTYQKSIVINHIHRISYIVEGNAAGKSHVAASFGWLGDLKRVDYMHRIKAARDWSLGFGLGYTHPETGFVYLQPVPIVEYSCVVEGELFKG